MRRTAAHALIALVAILVVACGGDSDGITDPLPSAQPFMGCANVARITPGQTVNGSLTSSDCRAPDNSFVDFYELTLTSARTVTISMNSSAFDAYLVVLDRAENLIAFDDDGGGATDARLVVNLQAGTYIIGANSFAPGETGAYQLSVN